MSQPIPDQSRDILTLVEAAELLLLPRSTVTRLAARGRIPARKVGKQWRFLRSQLTEWIREGGATSTGTGAQAGPAPPSHPKGESS